MSGIKENAACRCSFQANKRWRCTVGAAFCTPHLHIDLSRIQSCRNFHASPPERDDETNPTSFDQMKIFTQAIFQCHISLSLIHEIVLSHWYHLSSLSHAAGLFRPLSSCSRGDGCLRGTSVNQRLKKTMLHSQLQSATKKHMNLPETGNNQDAQSYLSAAHWYAHICALRLSLPLKFQLFI